MRRSQSRQRSGTPLRHPADERLIDACMSLRLSHRILPARRPHRLHGSDATRALEADMRTALGDGTPTLMQRAGDALASLAMAVAPHAERIWIAAGPGNNGGDGIEAGTRLVARGKTGPPDAGWRSGTTAGRCRRGA